MSEISSLSELGRPGWRRRSTALQKASMFWLSRAMLRVAKLALVPGSRIIWDFQWEYPDMTSTTLAGNKWFRC